MATSPPRQTPEESEQPGAAPADGTATARRADGRPGGPAQPSQNGQAPNGQAASTQVKIAVPEQPRLAPGIRLAGQMQESAFENPPWLIEREGDGYVQVTELLYRMAEQCDGSQSLKEIASAVSEATGRSVSADNVRQLIGTQLLAKGLVQTADGKVVASPAGSRSLLALSLRTAALGPDTLRLLARPFQVLLWPPVLCTIVVLSLVAIGWLLLVHGVAAGARSLLYAPSLMLVALAVTALGAAFHEFGHAAALMYGGGKPKSMGAGLYLVYPAFYTDVSDNYRLGRWGRVRTDLGGVLFHLVFMLGLIAAYALTEWEPVLIFVVLVLLDAFHQLLPLIRLDGYWTLADITGVPDFYSYMGAFVRRFIPGQQEAAAKLPKLKWWGTLVFAAYMLFAVPLMLFGIFMMLRATPSLLATGWDSAQQQFGTLRQAADGSDILAMVVAAVQLLVLSLPTAALIYSLVRFGRRIGEAVWNWSKPTPTRRIVGGLGMLAASGLLFYLWAPSLPFGGGGSGPLYGATRANFAPISAETRGTFFDGIGAPQPEWMAAAVRAGDRPDVTASPGPLDASGLDPRTTGSPEPALAAPTSATLTPDAQVTAAVTAVPTIRAATSVPTAAVIPTLAATVGAPALQPTPRPVVTATTAPATGPQPGLAPTSAPAAPATSAPAAPMTPPPPTPRPVQATPTPRPALSTPAASPAPR